LEVLRAVEWAAWRADPWVFGKVGPRVDQSACEKADPWAASRAAWKADPWVFGKVGR
jgi:hypothetical protein